MTEPVIPSAVADPDRLAALRDYGVLDTPSDSAFDDVVRVAADLCAAPVALVSLVAENRQWFKARAGIDLQETPIAQSVCAHGLSSTDLLIIPDLSQDPRTRDNALVTPGDGIRFYAGAPLVTPGGQVIGMLCVIDVQPRPDGLTEVQQRALRTLAHQVMLLLALHRSLRERDELIARQMLAGDAMTARAEASEAAQAQLRDSHLHARAAQEAGRIGTFELDVATDTMAVSPEFCALFGMPVAPDYPVALFSALVLDDDAGIASTAATRRDGSAVTDVEIRIRRADDGRLRWISRRSSFVTGPDGTVTKMFGTVHDVTDRRLAGERIGALLGLGDRLRDVHDPRSAAMAAADSLSEMLIVSRAGYADIDQGAGTFSVLADRAFGDAESLTGDHRLGAFPATLAQLAADRTLTVANVPSAAALTGEGDAFRTIGVRAMIVVPFIARGELVGATFVHDALPRTWSRDEVEFVHGVADRTHAALAKLRAEAEQDVLNGELSHRLKNTLSMVQAIANQTLRRVPDREPVEAFDRRLQALGTAHDILLRKNWTSAALGDTIAAVTARLGGAERFDLSGPDIGLSPQTTLSASLVIHELATNALKYGALSVPDGRVAVDWRVDHADRQATLLVAWREHGGPPVVPPTHKGFGSRLISRGLAGTGGVQLCYNEEGFAAEFAVSLASAQRS